MNKEERTKTLINNIKLNINEQNVYEFGLCVEQWKQILDYIEQLQQENKKLKEHIEKYERYCKTTGIEELIKNKKYKEVFEKAIEYLEEPNRDSFDYSKAKLLEILKEVE